MHKEKVYNIGTERVIPPQETLKKIKKHFKDIGITRVANITGLDTLNIPVATAFRPNSRTLAVSQGKGMTYEAAEVSAIMESIEGFHAERIFAPTMLLSYADISKKENIVAISNLARYKDSKFTSHTKIPWIEGYDLQTQSKKWLPFECIHTDYTEPWPQDHGHFITESNGLASGNTTVEATNHALYEVIERDALALWALKKTEWKKQKKINHKSLQGSFTKDLIDRITDQKMMIGIWDITSDLEIPTFLCKIFEPQETLELRTRPAYGSGTHINPEIALSRAITEAAQSRLTFIAGSRDDQYRSIYSSHISDSVYKTWHHEISETTNYDFQPRTTPTHDYLEDDQKFLLQRLKQAGLDEALVIDLTRPEYNIPVVKVVVPGLESSSFPGQRVLGLRGHIAYNKSKVGACLETIS